MAQGLREGGGAMVILSWVNLKLAAGGFWMLVVVVGLLLTLNYR